MEKYETRSVNWSHPMNNSTHLPPKSPHGAYSMFSSSSLFDNPTVSGLNPPPHPPNQHRRSPSAGYVPPQAGGPHQAWLSDRLGSPDVVLKKCSHRRSSSDSVAFVDTSYQYMNYLENVTEEEEFVGLQEPAIPAFRPAHRRGISADHGSGDQSLQYKLPATHRSYSEKASRADHALKREHFYRVREHEAFPRQQPLAAPYTRAALSNPGAQELVLKAKKLANVASPNSRSDASLLGVSRGGKAPAHWNNNISSVISSSTTATPSFENRSTASESNSHSDDSNDDLLLRSYERFEGRSEEVDGSAHAQEGCTSSDQVDPKKAKRILANRQSAQRSRVRKLQYISELEMNVNLLETEVASLSPKVGYYDHERVLLSAENALLKQKLVALANTQQIKEAYNETLKTELQHLRSLCNPVQNFTPQQLIPRPLSPDALELQLLRFSQLDLGSSSRLPKPKSPTAAYTRSSASGRPSLYPGISPTRSPNSGNSPNRPSPQRVPPSCMAPGGGGGSRPLVGGMMGGASFMVHNA